MGASGINWRNVPHEEILDQINGGAGVAGISDLPSGYRFMAETLRRADADLRDALAAAGASWEGAASDQTQSATTPLAQWAEDADQLASESGQRSSQYGDEYANTRTGMPAPVPIPSGGLFESVISRLPGVTTDREETEAASDAAHEEAAARMEAYDDASYSTVQTQYFSAPPQVVLEIAPSAGSGGSGIAGAWGTSVPASTPGSSYVPSGGYSAAGGVAPTPSGVTGGVAPTAPTFGGQVPAATPAGPYPGPGAPTSPAGPGGPRPLQPGVPLMPGAPGSNPRGGGSGRRRSDDGTATPPPFVPGGPGGFGAQGESRGRGGGSGDYGGRGGPSGPGAGFGSGEARGGAGKGGFNAFGPQDAAAARAAGAGMRGAPGTGTGGFGPAGAGRSEEDGEHRRPDYLVETEDVWGDGTRVAPPVIGERSGP